MKDIIVLDYYIKNLGCTSQLSVIMNSITHAHNTCSNIYIHQFNKDIFNKNSIVFNSLINIDETNKNLKLCNYNTQLLENDPRINYDNNLNIKVIINKDIKKNKLLFPIRDIHIFDCFVFNNYIMDKVKISLPNSPYYCIHLRIEIDAILYFIRKLIDDNINNYTNIKDITEQSIKIKEFINKPIVSSYIRYIMNQYKKKIDEIGKNNTFFICTAINKTKINKPLEYILDDIVNYIGKNNVIIGKNHYEESREINSLIELIIMIKSNGVISCNYSIFSHLGTSLNKNNHYLVNYNILDIKNTD